MFLKIIIRGIASIFQGLFVLLLVTLVDPFYPLDSYNTKHTDKATNIVLIHGHLNSTWSFYWMNKRLEIEGFNIYTPAYGSGIASLNSSAKNINDYIKSKNISNPIIIGTSIGGLIGIAYLNNFDKWSNCKQMVTIATPFKGTAAARPLKHISKSAAEVLPESLVLSEILNHPNIEINKILSFRAKFDETVPTKSSILAGAKNMEVSSFSHFSVQYLSIEISEYIKNNYS